MPTVYLHVQTSDGDADETDRRTRQLRQELLALDVDDITLPSTHHAPAGAKGDPISIGTLVVSLANSAALVEICRVVRAWVTRDHGRRITLKDGDRTLEITGANTAQHQQIIDAFVNNTSPNPRHASPPAHNPQRN